MVLKRGVLFAILVAAALVPATTASASHRHAPKLRLARVPLQTAQLGAVGASFALNYGSGPVSNDGAVSISESADAGSIISSVGSSSSRGGYMLDYGDPYTGSAGVTEIQTSVEVYRTKAGAKDAVRFAPVEGAFDEILLASPFVDVSRKRIKPPHLGQDRYGVLITRAAPNLNPIVALDEQVAAGRFVLDLTVTAGSASAAEAVAPRLLRTLHRRLQSMLAGRTLAKPPKLPGEPEAGQAPGGPDLSTLILQPTDVGQSHAVNLLQEYIPGSPTLSDFLMFLSPAGTYTEVVQQIGWWPSAAEAMYGESYGGGSPFPFFLSGDSGGTKTTVDLGAVGDSAVGYLVTEDGKSTAYVVLANGQAGESITATSDGILQASDVQSLAQAAADRLDAGLGP